MGQKKEEVRGGGIYLRTNKKRIKKKKREERRKAKGEDEHALLTAQKKIQKDGGHLWKRNRTDERRGRTLGKKGGEGLRSK